MSDDESAIESEAWHSEALLALTASATCCQDDIEDLFRQRRCPLRVGLW